MWGNCRIIDKKRVAKALLTDLGLGFQSGNVEESSIRSLSKVSSFSWRSKDVFSIMVKRVPNKVWARTHPCFTPLGILKVSEDEPSKTTLSFISSWKDLIIFRRFGGQPIFRSILKSPRFTRSKVRSMNEMHSDCLCSLQFSCNFLMENILSIVDCLARKPHCDSGQSLSSSSWRRSRKTRSRSFERFWWVRHLDSCCNLSCPPRICWG